MVEKSMDNQLVKDVKSAFIETFKKSPILVFSPGRVNIIGEHTDYNDGYVFPAAVNKGIVAAIYKSDTGTSTAIALDMNDRVVFDIKNIHPNSEGRWENYVLGVVAEIKKKNIKIDNFNIVFKGNIPSGAGMSSSAALENSVVVGLNELFNLGIGKDVMIKISQMAEHHYVGVNCGIMDQYASMYGIKNHALHLDCRSLESTPYEINFKDHQFLLINTNVKHSLSESAYNNRRSVCETIAKKLKIKALRDASENDLETIIDTISPQDYQKALFVIQENDRTIEATKSLSSNDLETLGALMFKSHEGLSKQYEVSCEELDFLVEKAKYNSEVIGSRMMGGGFGGCTINLVTKKGAKEFIENTSLEYKNKFAKKCTVYNIHLSEGTYILEK